MAFKNTIHIVGMKASKGTLDNGMSYDSTKVYALTSCKSCQEVRQQKPEILIRYATIRTLKTVDSSETER